MVPSPFAMHTLGGQYVLNGILDLGAPVGHSRRERIKEVVKLGNRKEYIK